MPELKPCPFCGVELELYEEKRYREAKETDSDNIVITWNGMRAVPVVFTLFNHPQNGCYLSGFWVHYDKIDLWNRRVDNG